MSNFCSRIANSESFQTFIFFLILVTAVSMGLETVPEIYEEHQSAFEILYFTTQTIFAFEILIRILAYSPNLSNFFRGFWNIFDFSVVLLSFVPFLGSFAPIARLLRTLRVVRLISNSAQLRTFSERLGQCLDEIFYSAIIASVGIYIFTIAGHYMFYEIDPANWASLGRSALSIFYLVLLQNIPQFVEATLSHSALSILFFIIFYFCLFGFVLSVISAALSQKDKN